MIVALFTQESLRGLDAFNVTSSQYGSSAHAWPSSRGMRDKHLQSAPCALGFAAAAGDMETQIMGLAGRAG